MMDALDEGDSGTKGMFPSVFKQPQVIRNLHDSFASQAEFIQMIDFPVLQVQKKNK